MQLRSVTTPQEQRAMRRRQKLQQQEQSRANNSQSVRSGDKQDIVMGQRGIENTNSQS